VSTRRIILRPDVPEDMHSIIAWLERYSAAAADRFADAVFEALDGLAVMPGKGSPKHFRNRRLEGVRSWAVPGFRKFLILYRLTPHAIDVLAVTHGSRNLRALLLKRV
jgi:toxin ParE1/3/4